MGSSALAAFSPFPPDPSFPGVPLVEVGRLDFIMSDTKSLFSQLPSLGLSPFSFDQLLSESSVITVTNVRGTFVHVFLKGIILTVVSYFKITVSSVSFKKSLA